MPEWLPLIFAVFAAIPGLLALRKDWRFGKPDALKRYEELVNNLTARVDQLNSLASIQATKLEAQTAKIEAQAAKIEAQAAKIEAQAAKIEAQAMTISKLTDTVNAQGQELNDFRVGVVILITQLSELNVEPKWKPKEKVMK